VRVAVRVRPFSSQERQALQRRALSVVGEQLVLVSPQAFDADPDAVALVALQMRSQQWASAFRFAPCLWSAQLDAQAGAQCADQVGLHDSLGLELVGQVLSGQSASCFAYGHTSTGKTYSLFGSDAHNREARGRLFEGGLNITPHSGLIQRVFHDVVRLSHRSTRVTLSFMEIYNEKIRDLLVDPSDAAGGGGGVESLKLREHSSFGPYVEGLAKIQIFSAGDALRLVAKGQARRTNTATQWNASSSRSHAV
ncbi:P-loop containing nucleoside triphosphate hydrolase protein, partial [Ochromonadaceae sp. CCMP2298]